jgi:hypothetical protein
MHPKHKQHLLVRQPVHKVDPGSFDKLPLRVQLDLLDFDHEYWGWNLLSKDELLEFLHFIKSMEKMTWAEIKATAGGKRYGTNHHQLELHKFYPRAQNRFKDLKLDRILGDTLFSLRKNNTTRIYGHRAEQYFRPIWYDRFHADGARAAYPLASH